MPPSGPRVSTPVGARGGERAEGLLHVPAPLGGVQQLAGAAEGLDAGGGGHAADPRRPAAEVEVVLVGGEPAAAHAGGHHLVQQPASAGAVAGHAAWASRTRRAARWPS